jgi:hypothetical protein
MGMGPNAGGQLAAQLGNLAEAIRRGRYPWWYPDNAKNLAIDYFVYATSFLPLTATTTTQNNINIGGDAAFCVLSGVLVETDTGNTTFLAQSPLLVRMSDAGAGRFIANQQVHASNWFGTAQEPKYWDVPKIFAPNSTWAIELQNLEATNRNVHVALHGFKIFGFQP